MVELKMKITEVHRTGNAAWSPASHNTCMFAVGTSAHQVDATFSTSAALEIFEFTPADCNSAESPPCRGVAQIDHRIFKLVWSPHATIQGTTSNGGTLVAGVEGGIVFYSADALLQGRKDALIREFKDCHTGAVRALDTSPILPNFLASGAGESDVLFWDLNIPGHSAAVGPKSFPLDEVSGVAWNKKIGYILASSLANRCVLWDMRKNDVIIKLQDQNSRIRYKSLDWNPEIATQLALASDDDHSPVIQIWDLRNASSAVKTLEGHKRGILSISWCPHDSGILLSSGKDGCVYGWNVQEDEPAEVIYSLPTSKGWPFEVSWCPRIPSVFISSSYDNSVGVYTVMGGHDASPVTPTSPSKLADSFPGMEGAAFAEQLPSRLTGSIRKAPTWLRRPGAFSFSFDGKIVKAAKEDGVFGVELGVFPSAASDLVQNASTLEQYLTYNQAKELCGIKVAASSGASDNEEWKFISTFFDEDQHQAIKKVLGFETAVGDDKIKPSGKSLATASYQNGTTDPHIPESRSSKGVGPFHFHKGDGVDASITRSLVLGNVEAAVEMCLAHDRHADALFLSLAGCGPALPGLYQKAREMYFASHGSCLSSLIYGIVKNDAQFLLENCNVEDWRYMAVLFSNHFTHEQFKTLTEHLGDRLEGSNSNDAISCYILAGAIEKAVYLWLTRKFSDIAGAEKGIQAAAEKLFLMSVGVHGNRPFEFGPNAVKLLTLYGSHLAAQGQIGLGLRLVNRFASNALAPLKQFLYMCLGPAAALREANIRQPPLPYFGKTGNRVSTAGARTALGPSLSSGGGFPQKYPTGPDQQTSLGPRASLSRSEIPSNNPVAIPGRPFTQRQNDGFQPPPPLMPSGVPGFGTFESRAAYPVPPIQSCHPTYPGGFQSMSLLPAVPPPRPPSVGGISAASGFMNPALSANPLPPVAAAPAFPQGGFYDPTVHSNTAQSSQPVEMDGLRVTSFQHKKLNSGWNDPPPLPAMNSGRRRSSSAVMSPSMAPPVTQPLMSQPFPQYTQPGAPLNPGFPPPGNIGFGQLAQPVTGYSTSVAANEVFPTRAATPPPPKSKEPIPAECVPLAEGFAFCLSKTQQASSASNDSHSVRKLEDVGKKLEIFNDCLRAGKLSGATLAGLSYVLQCMQTGDYASAANGHANLSSQSSFLEVGSFLPSIKVLIHLAQRYAT